MGIPLGGEDAFAAEVLHGDAETADSGKKVNEGEFRFFSAAGTGHRRVLEKGFVAELRIRIRRLLFPFREFRARLTQTALRTAFPGFAPSGKGRLFVLRER